MLYDMWKFVAGSQSNSLIKLQYLSKNCWIVYWWYVNVLLFTKNDTYSILIPMSGFFYFILDNNFLPNPISQRTPENSDLQAHENVLDRVEHTPPFKHVLGKQ